MNNIDELKQYFHKLGITDIFYSFNLIRPQEVFGEINHKQMIVSYIDEKKQKKFSTMPMDIDRGIFAMYRLTYSLYKKGWRAYRYTNLIDCLFDLIEKRI